MNKSTITRERLELIANFHRAMVLPPSHDEIEELARIALAAMDSEPVAYTDERNLGYIDRGRETAYLWGKQNSDASDVALYRHAQPAPVVPEEMTPQQASRSYGGEVRGYRDGWNACRAAMLQAEPVTTANKLGNSPVIPDTWIPVSERLPEEGGRYWCYVEEQNSLGKSHYQWNCSWNGEIWGGAMMYGRVTHWMPLPNPPKE
ncbi:hypothetical protein AWS46_02985 [Klebsiella aerogenes]|uniref:DUF551 domain-containing protein n=1 Tax=Klebsiella aerogenes TaxID=548 RepID=UPI000756EE3C|nr:DUF551 domain-containing protein [Klebsiella aerogenes]KVI72196.1 hypothetical protein AWS47_10820 [Klebsiella aerogenes]KVI72535.1 hypothetical protein AWS46_02985 [Klebsiella aerogenes]